MYTFGVKWSRNLVLTILYEFVHVHCEGLSKSLTEVTKVLFKKVLPCPFRLDMIRSQLELFNEILYKVLPQEASEILFLTFDLDFWCLLR